MRFDKIELYSSRRKFGMREFMFSFFPLAGRNSIANRFVARKLNGRDATFLPLHSVNPS